MTCTKVGKAAVASKRKAAGPSTSEGKRAHAKKSKEGKGATTNLP